MGHADTRQHFSGENHLMDPGDERNAAHGERRGEGKKRGVECGEEYRALSIPKTYRAISKSGLKK